MKPEGESNSSENTGLEAGEQAGAHGGHHDPLVRVKAGGGARFQGLYHHPAGLQGPPPGRALLSSGPPENWAWNGLKGTVGLLDSWWSWAAEPFTGITSPPDLTPCLPDWRGALRRMWKVSMRAQATA